MNSGITEKIFAAAIIKANLNDFASAGRIGKRKIGKPVMNIHPVTASAAATSITFTARNFAACST
jgi:hypothetical protein